MTLTEDRLAQSRAAVAEDVPAGGRYAQARRAMITSQLRTSGVNEGWVLEAIARVPREDYVPADVRDAAYIDRAVPLGNGKFLAAPLFQGKVLSEAVPTVQDKALLVGDGAGYLAALLRPLVGTLDAVMPGDTASGAAGGYSLLVIDGAIEELPESLADQLQDGGRIVTGLVERGVTRLAAGTKAAGTVSLLPLAEMGIPVLPEFAAPKRWSF
ncbi:protein-L-isoaspartate O-methyltransferase family protein [Novosphingobium sp. Leaf2]|uniref:protein-L-isoaspartate O-methyltransferase family protein n=1 Tax=Novosphingobium sp. Leaf2 TaxID=1735670 RepID=UPI0006F5802A|nr:protein-L-isoaspartate O-methyltransferase [Novosphingobium sp. Leaf2]KQM21813.1 protein-L-isoaspartate O-methyltransferase [Novosphingobium sp. Leaf2]